MSEFTGFIGVLLFLGALILVVVWLVFPFVVSNGLSRIVTLLQEQNKILKSAADRQNETNRALQFFIDEGETARCIDEGKRMK